MAISGSTDVHLITAEEMSPEEEATTTPPAEAEEPAAPAAIEETPTAEDTPANDAEEAPATADAGEDPEDGTAADREDVFAADDEATAELLAVGENLAGMTLADDLTGMKLTDEAPQPEPVKTPDVFDRMGYGSSEDGDGGERAAADVESDDDDRDLVAPLVDAIRRADSGEEPLSPSSIGAKAWALSYEISGFVATLDAPPGVDATIDELPPFIRDTVNALPTLARALALAPEPINTQRKIRIPAAGVHRVAVVEIIASLLEIGVADVDAAVAAANVVPGSLSLVPAVAAVLFTHTQGSPLLCVATRVVCLALQSPTEALWAPLLGDGWATAAADAGVTPAVGAEDDANLATRIAKAATEAMELRPGLRDCNVGFVLITATTMRDLEGDEDPPHLAMREALEADEGWQAFASEGGALERLESERSGGLCGPKPSRGMSLMDMAGGGGGGVGMTSQELLQVLQSLSAQR